MPSRSVSLYSGSHYAERPVALEHDGERLQVARVERSWREPDSLHFRVRVTDGRRFHLVYQQEADQWWVHQK